MKEELRQTKKLFNAGKYKEASSKLKEILSKEPNNVIAICQLARIHEVLGNEKEMLRLYHLAADEYNDPISMYKLGRYERNQNHYDKAKFYFRQIMKQYNDLYARFQLIKVNLDEPTKIDVRNQKLEYAYNELHYLLDCLDRKEERRKQTNGVFMDQELRSKVHYCLGLVCKEAMNYKEAKEHLLYHERHIHEKGILELAKVNIDLGDYDEAINDLKYLINVRDNLEAILELGKLQMLVGNLDKARHIFSILLDSKLKNQAYLCLADLEEKDNNLKFAKLYCQQVVRTSFANEAYVRLIKYARKENDKEAVVKYYKELKEKNTNPQLFNQLDFLETLLYKNFLIDEYSNERMGYIKHQILHYNLRSAINHIICYNQSSPKRLNNKTLNNHEVTDFIVNLNLDNAYFKGEDLVFDYYIVEAPKVALIYDDLSNHLEIATIHGTQNIVNARPIILTHAEKCALLGETVKTYYK